MGESSEVEWGRGCDFLRNRAISKKEGILEQKSIPS